MTGSAYQRACEFCGRAIVMRRMPPYGQWVAMDPDGGSHDCSDRQWITSVPTRPPVPGGKQRRRDVLGDLPFLEFTLPGTVSAAGPPLDSALPTVTGSSEHRKTAPRPPEHIDVGAAQPLVDVSVIDEIAEAISSYDDTVFRMSANTFWRLFGYPERTPERQQAIISGLRARDVELTVSRPQPGNEQVGNWYTLQRSAPPQPGHPPRRLMQVTGLPTPRPRRGPGHAPFEATCDLMPMEVGADRPQTLGRSDEPMQSLGWVLRRLRLRAGLTLEEVAERASISPSHLSRIERDETSPSFAVIGDLVGALGVTVRECERYRRDPGELQTVGVDTAPKRQNFGDVIRERRLSRGLTLDDVAGAAGISSSHLSRLERGRSAPSFEVIGAIARVLGMDVDVLAQHSVDGASDADNVADDRAASAYTLIADSGDREIEKTDATAGAGMEETRDLLLLQSEDEVVTDPTIGTMDVQPREWPRPDERDESVPIDALAASLADRVRRDPTQTIEFVSGEFWSTMGVRRRTPSQVRKVRRALHGVGLTVVPDHGEPGTEPLDAFVRVAVTERSDTGREISSPDALSPPIESESEVDRRSDTATMSGTPAVVCEHCATVLVADARFCHRCGLAVRMTRACSRCGTSVSLQDTFCHWCGQRLDMDKMRMPAAVSPRPRENDRQPHGVLRRLTGRWRRTDGS